MPYLKHVYLIYSLDTMPQGIEVNLAQLEGRQFCVCFGFWPVYLTDFSCILPSQSFGGLLDFKLPPLGFISNYWASLLVILPAFQL